MRTLILALVLLSAAPAFGGDAGPHWFEVHSAHFDVITNTNDKQARHIAAQLEQMRAVFHLLLPHAESDANDTIVVLALRNRKDFQTLEPAAYLAKGQVDLAGLFIPTPDRNYILLRLDAEGEHPFAVVYHEYTHFMVRHADYLPLWLNEGMAEFYQNTDIHEKDVKLGQPSADDILFLRQNALLPLTTLLAVDHNSPYYHEEQKGSVFYAESWALTHYIMVNDFDNKTHRMQDYLGFLIHHEDPVTAAAHAFGDLKHLQSQLDSYIQHGEYKLFFTKAAVTVDENTLKANPLPSADADSIRADVLVYTDRHQEARALLANVLREDPSNALAHESMGYLETRENNFTAARKWYGEAVKLNSNSYLAYYYYAVMSLQTGVGTGAEGAEIEASLRQSIKLNPTFAPAYDALAHFYAIRHEKLDEAHLLNIQAIQLEPANISYRLNAVQVLMEQESVTSAIGVLKEAIRVARTSGDRATLQARLDSIEQYQAEQSRREAEAKLAKPAEAGDNSSVTATFTEAPVARTPKYPAGPPTGQRHTIKGVLRSVHCAYPKVLTLTLDRPGSPVNLYTNDVYKIAFTASNFEPKEAIDPCSNIEGMKASVVYAEVTDAAVAGQIVSIQLSK